MIPSQMMRVDAIAEAPFNYNQHPAPQVAQLGQSLNDFAQFKNIVVWRGYCIAGNGLLQAAKAQGLAEIEVKDYSHLDEAQAKALCVADNALPYGAEADIDALQRILADLQNVEVPGVTQEWLDSLGIVPDIGTTEGLTDADSVPEIDDAEPICTAPGDVWQLGRHRLMCGDSTNAQDVARLMDGNQAVGCFTSPPYAEQRKEQYGGINSKEYADWFFLIQKTIKNILDTNGNFFLNIKPHAEKKQRDLYVFDLVCKMVREWGWLFVDEYCWLRTGIPQQVVNRFKNAFEPVYWFSLCGDFYFYPDNVKHQSDSVPLAMGKGAGDTNAARRQGTGKGAIYGNKIVEGMAYPSNVLNFKNNAEALGHPAAFPVQLPTFFIKAYSVENDLWFDPFCGSGTTLMACEQLGRVGYGMEISPRYCDVILKRWEAYTGQTAQKV